MQLKAKMNSIFKNDNELVRLICNKKVYPNVKNQVYDIVKKSAIQPLDVKEVKEVKLTKESKENQLTTKKSEKVILPPTAFAEVNRVL